MQTSKFVIYSQNLAVIIRNCSIDDEFSKQPELLVEYSRFLTLKVINTDIRHSPIIIPSAPVLAIWNVHFVKYHEHYRSICRSLFDGNVLAPLNLVESGEVLKERYSETRKIYEKIFGTINERLWPSKVPHVRMYNFPSHEDIIEWAVGLRITLQDMNHVIALYSNSLMTTLFHYNIFRPGDHQHTACPPDEELLRYVSKIPSLFKSTSSIEELRETYNKLMYFGTAKKQRLSSSNSRKRKVESLCSICHKEFSNLRRHMNTHNQGYRWHCRYCRKHFKQSNNLKTHLKQNHNIEKEEIPNFAKTTEAEKNNYKISTFWVFDPNLMMVTT